MGENFRELVKSMKTFTNSHKTTKFMKTFFLESFPLYGSRLEPETNSNTQNNMHFLLCIKLRGNCNSKTFFSLIQTKLLIFCTVKGIQISGALL